MEKKNNIQILAAGMKNENYFLSKLENCMMLDHPILLENMGEEISPKVIEPLILQ